MAHLPYHLQQESVNLNNQLDAIKYKIHSLQKKVQEHQNETPIAPTTPKSVNPYDIINNTIGNNKQTDTIHFLLNKPESPPKSPITPLTTQTMKKIHWKPIKSEKVSDSIWSQMDRSWADFEPHNFEKQFQASDCEKVMFLGPERRQQVQHGLASLRLSNEEIRDIILTLDQTRININKLQILIDIVPISTEQLQALQLSRHKYIKHFGEEEQFFYCLHDIKELRSRLKQWLFTLEFGEKLKQINEDVTIVEKAKLSVCLSRELRQLLCILLSFGNYMNCGNVYNQNCSGFAISDLYLLSNIKTAGPDSISFPMFLCEFLDKKYPKLLGNIIKQCKIVKIASQLECHKIDDNYFSLLQQISDLESMVSEYKDKYFGSLNINDEFITKMNIFQKNVNNEMWRLKFRVDSYHKCQSHLIKYFAYDAIIDGQPIKIQKIFKDINGFIEILQVSNNKLQKRNIDNILNLFSFSHDNKFVASKTPCPGACKMGEKSDSDISNNSPTNSEPVNFKKNRRNTETLRLELDIAELNNNKANKYKTETPSSVISHKSIEAKMNRFISQTPQVSHSHPSPYKMIAKRIVNQRKKQMSLRINHNETVTPASSPNNFMEYKANELKQQGKYANTPLASKSYVNPYKMIAKKINRSKISSIKE